MKKLSAGFQKILIIASFSMLLATIIISSITIDYIKQENIKAEARSQRDSDQSGQEIFKSGTVGEIKNIDSGENSIIMAENSQISPIVFNTTGNISEIKNDRLIINGDGSSFADGGARDLDIFFTLQTSVYIRSNQEITKYVGFDGLKYLKIGDNILVEGEENIRGKTRFTAKTINTIQ